MYYFNKWYRSVDFYGSIFRNLQIFGDRMRNFYIENRILGLKNDWMHNFKKSY